MRSMYCQMNTTSGTLTCGITEGPGPRALGHRSLLSYPFADAKVSGWGVYCGDFPSISYYFQLLLASSARVWTLDAHVAVNFRRLLPSPSVSFRLLPSPNVYSPSKFAPQPPSTCSTR